MADVLTLTADHAQQRIKTTAVTWALRGEELWGFASDATVCLEPVTNTGILCPYQYTQTWFQSNAGNYAKPTLASGYDVNTTAKWKEIESIPGAGTYLQCADSSGEYARTDFSLGINQGMFLSFHGTSAGDTHTTLECGWHSTNLTAETASVGLRFVSDGTVYVFQAGVLIGQGNIGACENRTVHCYLLPGRRRELILWTADGRGFTTVFESIEESDTAGTIAPATKFFVVPGSANELQLQFCELRFPTSGVFVSDVWSLGKPPRTGATQQTWNNPIFTTANMKGFVRGDKGYPGTTDITTVVLRNATDTADFTPDDTEMDFIHKATLTGDGDYTPFLYGNSGFFKADKESTNSSEEIGITDYVVDGGFSFSVPDDSRGATLSCSLALQREEVVVEADVTTTLESEMARPTQLNRPMRLDLGALTIFDGTVTQAKVANEIHDGVSRVRLEVADKVSRLEHLVFRTRWPLDGLNYCKPPGQGSAMEIILQLGGYDSSELQLSDIDYVIGQAPGPKTSEWCFEINAGDSLMEVLRRLHSLAGDRFMGTHPGLSGPEFWFLDTADLPSSPSVTVYRTLPEAIADTGLTEAECIDLLYFDHREEYLRADASEVLATGVEPRTGKMIHAYTEDLTASDPDIAPSLRGANWLGDQALVGIGSRQLRSLPEVEATVRGLTPIATEAPLVGEFSTNAVLIDEDGLPVWRGDLVQLFGIDPPVRITSVSIEAPKEIADGLRGAGVCRSVHYTYGAILGIGGTTIDEIQAAQQTRLARRWVDDLTRRNPIDFTGIVQVSKVT